MTSFSIIEPDSTEELDAYYQLRFEVLRKPGTNLNPAHVMKEKNARSTF
ncbi:MAG: hypothetical protein IPG90_10145 [Bacteroidetes bacterium]|nr:hypothetical protein [Bacteroidota bacterium]